MFLTGAQNFLAFVYLNHVGKLASSCAAIYLGVLAMILITDNVFIALILL